MPLKLNILPADNVTSLVGAILVCHTSYHRTVFYRIVRETAKCVYVQRARPRSEEVYSDPTQVTVRVIGFEEKTDNSRNDVHSTAPTESVSGDALKEYRLLKKDNGTFRGKADSCRVEDYRLWDGQPLEVTNYY